MKKTFNKILLLCAVALMATACDENAIPELTEPVAEDSTFIKFFLNSDDAPAVNFYFDDKKVSAVSSSSADEVKGNDYATVFPSNAYALISAASVNINAKDLEGNVVATKSFTFEKNKHYSAYLLGNEGEYDIWVLEDPLPVADNVKIYWRFVNTMTDIPFAVDVFAIKAAVAETETTPAQPVKIVPLGNGLAFKQAGEYKELEPGKYVFKVFESGTDYDIETSKPYIQNTITLASKGRVYSTQIRGTYKPTPVAKNIDYWRER